MANQAQSNIVGVLLSLGGFALYSTHDVIVKLLGRRRTNCVEWALYRQERVESGAVA